MPSPTKEQRNAAEKDWRRRNGRAFYYWRKCRQAGVAMTIAQARETFGMKRLPPKGFNPRWWIGT